MERGISHLAFIPLRKDASDASEMISQLLFGETYDIMDKKDKWFFVKNHFDNYEGWIFNSSVFSISDNDFNSISEKKEVVVTEPFINALHNNPVKNLVLPFGSILRDFTAGSFTFLGEEYKTQYTFLQSQSKIEAIINSALKLINTPYLWGGRSSFGIDCSGLVQTCFRIIGIKMPRDAYQQAEIGSLITLNESQTGDLAFFTNDKGRIVHTGILLDKNQIIHASVKVRIDRLDDKGIFNDEKGFYTHTLSHIMRVH